MGEVITVLSGKGGVGKTIVSLNLAAALEQIGYDTILVEGNVTSPTASIYLGYLPVEKTMDKVSDNELEIDEIILKHESGVKLMTCSLNVSDLEKNLGIGFEIVNQLKEKSNIVLIDGAAGLGEETVNAIKMSSYILIVTNPELPAVIEALRTVRLARGMNKKIVGIVLNKVNPRKHQMTEEEVELIVEIPIISIIPEDDDITDAIAYNSPVVTYKPEAESSIELKRLASKLVGEPFKEPPKKTIIDQIMSLLPKKVTVPKMSIPGISIKGISKRIGGKIGELTHHEKKDKNKEILKPEIKK